MNINKINYNQNFGATLSSGCSEVISTSVKKGGMCKNLAKFLVGRINKHFPEKDYFIRMNPYRSDIEPNKIFCSVTVERKLPQDWDPDKSLYKVIYFKKPEDITGQYKKWANNTLFKFVQAVKKLSKKDWDFTRNLKKGTKVEYFNMD